MRRLILMVIIPLFLGGVIYILFRSEHLVMFRWFNIIGLGEIINELRSYTYGHIRMPEWMLYSLPDALWVFSFTSFMLIVWKGDFSIHSAPWVFIAPTIGLLSEIGQAFHIVRGTFDIDDLVLLIIASLLPFIVFKINKHKIQIL